MPATGLAQPTVPYGADQTIYVVIDNSGAPGSVMSEVECPDLEAVVTHLMAGQFSDPMRVMAFNTLEHWSHDLSADVANEIQARIVQTVVWKSVGDPPLLGAPVCQQESCVLPFSFLGRTAGEDRVLSRNSLPYRRFLIARGVQYRGDLRAGPVRDLEYR